MTSSLKRYTRRVHAGTAHAAAQPLPRSQTFYAGRQATLSLCLALPMPLGVGLACSGELRSSPSPYSPFPSLSFTTFRRRGGNTDGISLEGTTHPGAHPRGCASITDRRESTLSNTLSTKDNCTKDENIFFKIVKSKITCRHHY